jgi:hypothetical protein
MRILSRLSPLAEDGRIVLIDGQAVAWWTYFLGRGDVSNRVEIFTSVDIDFEGAARSAQTAADLIGGEVRIPRVDDHTSNTGQVLFTDADGVRREIDFLGAPMGLDAADVRCPPSGPRRGWGPGPDPRDASRSLHGEPRAQRGRPVSDRADRADSAAAIHCVRASGPGTCSATSRSPPQSVCERC